MIEVIPPYRLAENVKQRLSEAEVAVSVFWVCVPTQRDAYASEIRTALAEEPVTVLVIRDSRFTNANAVVDEFVELVEEHRDECVRCLAEAEHKCGFVLLSRVELTVPQVGSPVVLPEWFPVGGGRTLELLIEDVTWVADAPLAAEEFKTSELSELLFELEGSLLRRFEIVHAADTRCTNKLLELIRRGDEKLTDIFETARAHEITVTTPSAFRPSRRDGSSIIARLWSVVQGREPDRMRLPSEALAEALGVSSEIPAPWHECLVSVLGRPTEGEREERLRFARNLLLSVTAASQAITAAAHSDDYAHYPVALLRSTSLDVRSALRDSANIIERL